MIMPSILPFGAVLPCPVPVQSPFAPPKLHSRLHALTYNCLVCTQGGVGESARQGGVFARRVGERAHGFEGKDARGGVSGDRKVKDMARLLK